MPQTPEPVHLQPQAQKEMEMTSQRTPEASSQQTTEATTQESNLHLRGGGLIGDWYVLVHCALPSGIGAFS